MQQHITLQGCRLKAAALKKPQLVFDFDPFQATFSKQGDDLVIKPSGGEASRIEGFFSIRGNDAEFVIDADTTLNAKDFFLVFGPDLVTAVGGVIESSALSSHMRGYEDEAGNLTGGVDRLGMLDAPDSAPENRTTKVIIFNSFVLRDSGGDGNAAPDPGGHPPAGGGTPEDIPTGDGTPGYTPSGGDTPGDTPAGDGTPGNTPAGGDTPGDTPAGDGTPGDIPTGDDTPGDIPAGDGTPGSPVTPDTPQAPADPEFRIVVYGNAGNEASWQPGVKAGPLSFNGAAVTAVSDGAYGAARLLSDGSILYSPAPGVSDWPENGGPLTDYIAVTLGDGSLRRIEVLVLNGASHDAAGYADLGGEWHEGLVEAPYSATLSGHNDVFVRRTGSTGLASGSSLDMGKGDDLLLVDVSAAAGAAKGIAGGAVAMGGGNDTVGVSASASIYNVYAYGVTEGSRINLGDGDNSMSVNATNLNSTAHGLYTALNVTGAGRTAVLAGDGNDSLDITIRAGISGTGINNSLVSLGGGDNRLSIAAQGGSGLYGMQKADIATGGGDDTVSVTMGNGGWAVSGSTLSLGDGNNLLSITGADSALSGNVTLGGGNDSILIESTRSYGGIKYGIYGPSAVNAGAGDDLLRVTLSGGNDAEALRTGAVSMGDGNDTVSFRVSGQSSAGGMNDGSLLSMGKGHDVVNISAATRGHLAFGMHNGSRVDLGEGDDSMSVDVSTSAAQANTYAYGLASGTRVAAGDGNDSLFIRAAATTLAANGTAEADGIVVAYADMGAGDDSLSLEVSATGASAIARGVYSMYYQSDGVSAGAGDDRIDINAAALGKNSALAVGISNAILDAGAGNDSLDIHASAAGGGAVAAGLQQAVARMGEGGDAVRIAVHSDGDAYGITEGTDGFKRTSGSLLDLGGGNNTLTLDAHGGHNAYGIRNSTLLAGDGNDRIDILAGGENAYGLHGGVIGTGGGDDHLTITAAASGVTAALTDSSIDLGSGDDFLKISGDINGSSAILAGEDRDTVHIDGAVHASGSGALVDMGSGDDLLVLGPRFSMDGLAHLHGGTGIDTLKLAGGMDLLDFSANPGGITGFERLDLSEGAQEITLDLNSVLSLTNDVSGAGQGESLRVLGGSDDAVHLSGGGWTIDTSRTVTLTDGNGAAHDFHTAFNGNTTVYIEDQIRMDILSITG